MIVGWSTWRGSGATTAALAMAMTTAMRLDHPVWLVEADPAGGVLAARLGIDTQVSGLEHLAFPVGTASRTDATSDWFAGAAAISGHLRLIPAPGDAFRAWSCHTPRTDWVRALCDLDGDVVIDLGRMRSGSPIGALLDRLDLLLLVSADDVASVAAAVEWAEARGQVAPQADALAHDITRIVVADTPGSPEPISWSSAHDELGDRIIGRLPWSPETAAAVNRGAPISPRHLRRDRLFTAVEHITVSCRQQLAAHIEPVHR